MTRYLTASVTAGAAAALLTMLHGCGVVSTQRVGPCAATFRPGTIPISSLTFGAVSSGGYIEAELKDVFTGPWYIASAPDWITFVRPSVRTVKLGPPTTATFLVAPNPSPKPRDGTIVTCDGTSFTVHQAGRTPRTGHYVPGDFDGDGKADLTLFRSQPGVGRSFWNVLQSHAGYAKDAAVTFELPVPPKDEFTSSGSTRALSADLDGDGKSDLVRVFTTYDALFPHTLNFLYSRLSSNAYDTRTATEFRSGGSVSPDDILLVADFTGRGKDDIVTFNSGVWSVVFSSPALEPESGVPVFGTIRLGGLSWGTSGDIPLAADYDGDGKADLVVFRPSEGRWYILQSSTNYSYDSNRAIYWGTKGDVPLSGDFDGDGLSDIAAWRPSTGVWFVLLSSRRYDTTAPLTVYLGTGAAGDIPVPLDYDGDGKTDPAVWRPSSGTWFLLLSSSGFASSSMKQIDWGLGASGDQPVRR